jgi:hypothetical protein
MSTLFSIKHDLSAIEFKMPDSLEQKPYRPLILDWLSRRYDLKPFQHSFKDQWLSYNIWCGQLTISHNTRVEEQVELFNSLPDNIKGCKQQGTGKMVNLKTLYFTLSDFLKIEYPEITKQELFKTDRSKDDDGDDFIVYNYKVHLSDGTILYYSNQKLNEPMDMQYLFPTYIQERAFLRYIKGI